MDTIHEAIDIKMIHGGPCARIVWADDAAKGDHFVQIDPESLRSACLSYGVHPKSLLDMYIGLRTHMAWGLSMGLELFRKN